MIRKLFKIDKSKTPQTAELEALKLLDEIKQKQQSIAEQKEEAKNDRNNGARVTKHRFTV